MGDYKYRLINYFDVWGNEQDGYEVNDSSKVCEDLEIPDEATDKEILTILKDIGFLTTDDMRKVYLENMGDSYEIVARKDNYPLGRLEIVYN